MHKPLSREIWSRDMADDPWQQQHAQKPSVPGGTPAPWPTTGVSPPGVTVIPPGYFVPGQKPLTAIDMVNWAGVRYEKGQVTKRLNRVTYRLIFTVAIALIGVLLSVAQFVVTTPRIPVVLVSGEEADLTAELAQTVDGCSRGLRTPSCLAYWTSQGVSPAQLQAIERRDDLRLGLYGFALLPFVILSVACARRGRDGGRQMVRVPFVFLLLLVVQIFTALFEREDPLPNEFGPPPAKGIYWPAFYGKQAVA
jgi:hypothetical protein